MHKQTIALIVGAVLLLGIGAIVVPQLFGEDAPPTVHWAKHEDLEVVEADANPEATNIGETALERSAVELGPDSALADDGERVDARLRGRVVDKFGKPIPDAKVWLDFGRGGRGGPQSRQRRVPDPVITDGEGRFAFEGQTFRRLRVTLQVAHRSHAPGLFNQDFDSIGTQVDLGDLVLKSGGEVIGRVVDLDGNGIAGTVLQLQPDNQNPLRIMRNLENLLASFSTDNNGYYRQPFVGPGVWTLTATAKMHTEGRSSTFTVEEDQQTQVEDIRLGPGYELSGYVRDPQGKGIAKANVTAQAQSRGNGPANPGPGGGRGAWRGFGRDHNTQTDEQGHFFLEHLPAGPLGVEVDADGYLNLSVQDVDPKLGQPLQLTMAEGLRITGHVVESDGAAVSVYAVRATWVRGLPAPGTENIDIADLMTKMRDGNLDEATRTQLRAQFDSLRNQFGNQRRNRGPDNGPPDGGGGPGGGFSRDLGKPERHRDGLFVLTGLQEGVYQVQVQSADHARYRSADVEVRAGAMAPDLTVTLDAGVFVAGSVVDDTGAPVANAQVELRPNTGNDPTTRRRGQNGNQDANGQPDWQTMGRNFLAQMQAEQGTLEARTDKEGTFVIKHVARGSYRLRAQARGFADANSDPFDLAADTSGFELKVGSLGSIAGRVSGLAGEELAQARVAAIPVGGGQGGLGAMFGRGRGPGGGGPGGGGDPFRRVQLAGDGTYRIDELVPGDYIVRCWLGSPQDILRELMPQMFSGQLPADVTVRAKDVARFDLAVTRPQIGTVAGTVLENGKAASNRQVELVKLDDAGNPNGGSGNQGGFGGPGGRGRMFGGQQQASVTSAGRFQIESVPSGTYQLRVRGDGRRALFETTVQVVTGVTTEVPTIAIFTQSVKGTIFTEDGSAVSDLRGMASLQLDTGAGATADNDGRRDGSAIGGAVRNGAFTIDAVPAGNYVLTVTCRGREPVTMPLAVQQGVQAEVRVAAGKVQPTDANGGAGGAATGNGPRTGGGPTGNGGNGGPGGRQGGRGGRRGGNGGGGSGGGGNTGGGANGGNGRPGGG